MWRLCVTFRYQPFFSMAVDNDNAGQVQSELSAKGTKREVPAQTVSWPDNPV